MLAVVEDEQELSRCEVVEQRLLGRAAGERRDVECARGGGGDEPFVGDARQLDERHAVGEPLLEPPGELDRQPGLAAAADAGERQHPRVALKRRELSELVLAPDEGAALLGQPPKRRGGALSRRALLQLAAQALELLAPLERPVLVAVLGQQLAGVQGQRGAEGSGRALAPGLLGRALELLHVDTRVEHQQLLAHLDRGGAEDTACRVHDLVQVVGRGCRISLRPQGVHQLFAVQGVTGCEREQLDQVTRLAQPPANVVQGGAADRDREAAQQRHGDVVRGRVRAPAGC